LYHADQKSREIAKGFRGPTRRDFPHPAALGNGRRNAVGTGRKVVVEALAAAISLTKDRGRIYVVEGKMRLILDLPAGSV